MLKCPRCGQVVNVICDCDGEHLFVDWDDWTERVELWSDTVANEYPDIYDTHAKAMRAAVFSVSIQMYSEYILRKELEKRSHLQSQTATPDSVRSYCVYFIQGESGGPIKIGITTDLAKRLKAIPYHEPLRVLAILPGGHVQESELHQRFADLRLSGEWFRPERSLLDFIVSIKDDHRHSDT